MKIKQICAAQPGWFGRFIDRDLGQAVNEPIALWGVISEGGSDRIVGFTAMDYVDHAESVGNFDGYIFKP
jgi:hypothetical protein